MGKDTLWLTVVQYDVQDTAGSPPGKKVNVTGPAWWVSTLPFPLTSPPNGLAVYAAERLSFGFSVLRSDPTSTSAGQQAALRLDDLAFGFAHPRYWNGLPDDEAFYVARLPDASAPSPPLWSELAHPRFPLAGIADETAVFVPINMSYAQGSPLGSVPASGSALYRDGLDEFKLKWFVDCRLGDVGLLELPATVGLLASQMPGVRPLSGRW